MRPHQLRPLRQALRPVVLTKRTVLQTPSLSRSLHSIHSSQAHIPHRTYATENKDVDPKLVELIYKMQTTPAVMDAIHDFETLVRRKGFDSQTGVGQFFSFMKDKEIEEALQRIMFEMDNAGIRISHEIVQPLLKSMSKTFNTTPFK